MDLFLAQHRRTDTHTRTISRAFVDKTNVR